MASLKARCPKCGAFVGHITGVHPKTAQKYPDGTLEIPCGGCMSLEESKAVAMEVLAGLRKNLAEELETR